MKIAVVLNGISFRKDVFYKKYLPDLLYEHTVDVYETRTQYEGIAHARRAVDKRYDVILAAGGDGTLNHVINGVVEGRERYRDLPVIGIIPLGSGNDFARGLNLHEQGRDKLLKLLREFKPRRIDVGKVHYIDNKSGLIDSSYFINVVDVGMGPVVVQKVTDSDRLFGSAVAYYTSILSTFFSYSPMMVEVTTPHWTWKDKARSLAFTIGKYYGHGLCIAPDAKQDDGIFSAFLCGNVSVLDFILCTGKLKRGDKIELPQVSYKDATHIELKSEHTCLIEADGEILGQLPATIETTEIELKLLY
jgi:YegS/Rv2252/BmrU family lipid kinase